MAAGRLDRRNLPGSYMGNRSYASAYGHFFSAVYFAGGFWVSAADSF